MKFNYKICRDGTPRPVIAITLENKGIQTSYEVLVDSGADICIFHSGIADVLGLDWQKGQKREVFGIGGKASVYYLLPVKIIVGGWPFEIVAGFMPNVAGIMDYGVVGQKGFFDIFVVKFDLLKEEIELKARNGKGL